MVKEVGKLRNLCHTKRVKDVKILNPAVLMGISGSPAPSTETMYELWGHDPVHPNEKAYKLMADRIIEETGSSRGSLPPQATVLLSPAEKGGPPPPQRSQTDAANGPTSTRATRAGAAGMAALGHSPGGVATGAGSVPPVGAPANTSLFLFLICFLGG